MIALCFLIFAFTAPDTGETLSPEDALRRMKPAWIQEVEARLAADKTLLANHRGYLRRLEKDPDLAHGESNAWELKSITRFREAEAQFDETLLNHPELQARFNSFYDELFRNPDLRATVDMLQRTLFSQRREGDSFAAALDWFKANPDQAMRFFNNPSHLTPTPEAIYPLLDHFRDHPELLDELEERFRNLTGQQDMWTEVLPWWQAIQKLDSNGREAWRQLSSHFLEHANRFWIWHQHQLLLARDAQTRAWIRWWYRRIRRDPQLKTRYIQYLRWLREHPDIQIKTEAMWKEKAGEADTWPPKTAPPRLNRLPEKAPADPRRSFRREDHMPVINRPEKPVVNRPTMPTRPVMPTRPTRPEKPEKPPTPEKPVSAGKEGGL